ncbi:MAG TPA: peptidylprolyl isomerase [Gammaproteobacteria bacterium]
MRKILFTLLPALLLLAACEGNSPAPAATEEEGIASVNGEAITEAEFNAYAERRTGSDPAALEPMIREQLLNELVNIELLAQAAAADKLAEKSPLKEQLAFQRQTAMADAAMTAYLEKNPVPEETVRAEYEKRKAELSGTEYKARHILVEDEATANDLIAQLEGGADFAELAKAHSIEPGADQSGGDLGWFSPAQMVPQFAAAVTSMQPGDRSQAPVQTQFGWHVIAVEDKREVPPPPFEQVAPQIQRFLTSQHVQSYINELRGKAEISGVETETATETENAAESAPAQADEGTAEETAAEPVTEPTDAAEGEESKPEA